MLSVACMSGDGSVYVPTSISIDMFYLHNKNKYWQYLQSNHWRFVSDLMYQHKKYQCFFHAERKYNLEKHHATYKWILLEQYHLYCLFYLCPECHQFISTSNSLKAKLMRLQLFIDMEFHAVIRRLRIAMLYIIIYEIWVTYNGLK